MLYKTNTQKEVRREQEKDIHNLSTGRIVTHLIGRHKFILAIVYGVFITAAWAYQSLPSAVTALVN